MKLDLDNSNNLNSDIFSQLNRLIHEIKKYITYLRIVEKSPVNLIIIVTGVIGFLQGVQRFLIAVALVHYDWNLSDYGLVYIFSALAMTIPMIISGVFTDIRGRKQIIIISFLLSTLGSLGLMLTIVGTVLLNIIISQILATISFGIAEVGLTSIMADETIPGFHRTNLFGKQATIKNLASFLGPFLMGLYLDLVINFSKTFDLKYITIDVIQSGFLIIALIALFGTIIGGILPPTPQTQIIKNKKANLTDLSPPQMKMYKAFGAEQVIIGFTSGLIVPFIDYYILTEFEPNTRVWGFIFGLSNSTIALGTFFVGRYAEKFGKGKTILFLNLFSPIFALGIALVDNFWAVGIFYVLRAGVANATQPAWSSWFYAHTPDTLRGRSLSVIHISRRFARAAGTAAGPTMFLTFNTILFPMGCFFYPIAVWIPLQVEKSIRRVHKETKPLPT